MAVLITGAAGFIGSNLVHHLLERWPAERIVSLDLLTYSGHLANLADVMDHERHVFVQADVADREAIGEVFRVHDVRGVIHLAAESHVDRGIVDPLRFVRTNVLGTAVLLEQARASWGDRGGRFHHVSTDEVFGALGPEGRFDETTPYRPNSPYSATKAGADHLVRAWSETYQLPVVVTNCTNNYGPRQFPEKLLPLALTRALEGEPVPVYGTGANVRDWLYVEDHCDALGLVYETGADGATYCIGGEAEVSNLEFVGMALDELDAARGLEIGTSRELIEFVTDRPGHDFRYAMDIGHIAAELGWRPTVDLAGGLARTVRWYLENADWLEAVQGDDHRTFTAAWYAR